LNSQNSGLPFTGKFNFVILVFLLLSEGEGWSSVPISACLRRGPRGYFRSECCTGGESMAEPRVYRSLYIE